MRFSFVRRSRKFRGPSSRLHPPALALLHRWGRRGAPQHLGRLLALQLGEQRGVLLLLAVGRHEGAPHDELGRVADDPAECVEDADEVGIEGLAALREGDAARPTAPPARARPENLMETRL